MQVLYGAEWDEKMTMKSKFTWAVHVVAYFKAIPVLAWWHGGQLGGLLFGHKRRVTTKITAHSGCYEWWKARNARRSLRGLL
jgi:hypothetical protein